VVGSDAASTEVFVVGGAGPGKTNVNEWEFERRRVPMVKSAIFIGTAMVTLLAGNLARAEDCNMINPSFEDDALINDIAIQEPNGWSVDLLYDMFGGYVASNWSTDGPYSLTLHSEKRQYLAGDTARVSQQIDLIDVNYITFDVKLATVYASAPWDPNVCSAVLLIDDDVVWESNSVGSDVRGEYLDRVYVVEAKYKTEDLHILSLGMRTVSYTHLRAHET